jgi:hypothetical protein
MCVHLSEPLPSPVLLGIKASAAPGASSPHVCNCPCFSNQSARCTAGDMSSMRWMRCGCFCEIWERIKAPVELPMAFQGFPLHAADICKCIAMASCDERQYAYAWRLELQRAPVACTAPPPRCCATIAFRRMSERATPGHAVRVLSSIAEQI